jgi:hypothetical protein
VEANWPTHCGRAVALYFIVERLCQRVFQAVNAAERVVKFSGIDEHDVAGRCPLGGVQMSALNSVLPASVNGCGRFGSTR